MKIVINLPDYIMEYIRNNDCLSVNYDDEVAKAIINGTPYEESSQGEWVEEIIDELESRKDYGTEYAQAMEDVIVILKAKFGIEKEAENECKNNT